MQPELIADYACVVGEGPLWHPDERRLYWTDIDTARLFRYDPASGVHEMVLEGVTVGGFTVQADGSLLLFGDRGAVTVRRPDGTLEPLIEEIPDERESRFNDVIADPAGRVFCGTMPDATGRPGRLYRLDADGTLTVLLEGIGCSNGMGFTPDRRGMYYTDSARREIYRFRYDATTGALSNQRLFVRTPEDEGVPDGLTVDADGNVWSARWDGACLVCYAPDGVERRRIAFPVKKVSSVTFADTNDRTDMYVTTAGGDQKETDGAHAGALFRLNLDVRGGPEFVSRIGL